MNSVLLAFYEIRTYSKNKINHLIVLFKLFIELKYNML